MTYLTIDEINASTDFAPIGFEKQFEKRIKKDIKKTIKSIKLTCKLHQIKNSPYYNIIGELLDPYFLETYQPILPGNEYNFCPVYRKNTSQEFYAFWDCTPETRGTYHRKKLKEFLLTNFDHFYSRYENTKY
mgnify:CR=1 FL=1|tara:strand:+ start:271 stop:666 length:396 start_codon:yes stop_codon:yes gene_type:complete